MLERWFPSRLAPAGALAEAETPVMAANVGNTAGRPAASSRDLKMLLQNGVAPSVERIIVGALVPIATGAARRLGGGHGVGEVAGTGNLAGSPSASSCDLKMLLQNGVAPSVERIAVGALLRIATGAARRLGGGHGVVDGRWHGQHRREACGLQS
ncbi:hypothetical protein DU490_16760 [Halomonas sp. DQ26W]|nr:hypothetical protein DU490_16760 [Halomonas sp. DQ26W]